MTPAQHASQLARHPYDLRHAGVSLALNAGVPATEVVTVLLKIYAHCIDSQAEAANKRIADALGSDDPDRDGPGTLASRPGARRRPCPAPAGRPRRPSRQGLSWPAWLPGGRRRPQANRLRPSLHAMNGLAPGSGVITSGYRPCRGRRARSGRAPRGCSRQHAG